VDIADLKEILRILEAQDITEFELEQDGVKLRVCRAPGGAPPGGPPTVSYVAGVAGPSNPAPAAPPVAGPW
jgi:hypothetical protein